MTDTVRTRRPGDERRLAAFERRMALPIFVSAVLPIVLTLAGDESVLADVVLIVTWFVFLFDMLVHARFIPGYLRSRQGVFDLVVVILTAPWFLIPGLGDTELLAVARLARLARVVKAGGRSFTRLAAQLGQVGLVTALLVVTCAYVGYGAERSVNDTFASFGDAIWWATVTITTVGYGDVAPVTTTGRAAAAVLMVSGIAVLGVLAGSLASFFGFGGADTPNREPRDGTTPAVPEPTDRARDDHWPMELDRLREHLTELDQALATVRQRLR